MAEPTDRAATPSLPRGSTTRRIALVPQADGTLQVPAQTVRHLALQPDGTWLTARRMTTQDLLRQGSAMEREGRLLEAEAAYRECIRHQPPSPEAMGNLAIVLDRLKRHGEAEHVLRELIALDPRSSTARVNLGAQLVRLGRHDEAVAVLRAVLQVAPLDVGGWNNLGAALLALDRVVEAESAWKRAIQLAPRGAEFQANMGLLHYRAGHLQAAEAHLRDAHALSPSAADMRFNLGLVLLGQGRYEEAWPLFETRLQHDPERPPAPSPRRWTGEPLEGRSVLLWQEQGHGDTIQFVRYAPMLKARGAGKVTLAAPALMLRLLESVPGVDALVRYDTPPPPHDRWVPLPSLPSCFGTKLATVPAELPYLHAPPRAVESWRGDLPAGLRVGLAWAGSRLHANDRHRSLPGLETLRPLWRAQGVSFISVQKDGAAGSPAADGQALPGQPLVALGARMQDFADLAAIVSQLDLLVTVDTAAAHVGGALGKPTWVLLPSWGCDWRWMRDRDDSPWYPNVMRLYRQATPGDWGPVIEQVAADLSTWAADKARRRAGPRRKPGRKG